MIPNPYEPPALSPATEEGARSRRMVRRAASVLFRFTIVVGFTFAVGGAIWLFYNGYPWTTGIGTLVVFMIAAGFVGTTWRERIISSSSVLFLCLGGICGFRSYFAMFKFSWFVALFNDKGSGPFGLVLFVSVFALGVGFAGTLGLDRMTRRLLPRTTKRDGADHSGSAN